MRNRVWRRRSFSLVELAVIVGSMALIGLFLFCTPARHCCGTVSYKQKCANNLKGIAIGLILYSNDYQDFPHMRSHREENTAADVSTVMRTLVQLKYIDNTEAYICPSSEDIFIQPPKAALDDPKLWDWGGKLAPSPALAITTRGGPPVQSNPELSYTYLRKARSAASARTTTIISADKSLVKLDKSGDRVGGNHTDGFNIAYADGHVSFVPTEDRSVIAALAQRVHLFEGTTPLTPAAVKAGE